MLIGVAGCGIKVVDTGHRGIKTTFGKVVSESLDEGIYFYNPITSAIRSTDWAPDDPRLSPMNPSL